MKPFACSCGQPLFFDNMRCVNCGREVAYDPTARTLISLEPAGDGLWMVVGDEREPRPRFRLCTNRTAAAACNWLVPASAPGDFCLSCRLTRTIPSLRPAKECSSAVGTRVTKRRVLLALQHMNLPLIPKSEDAECGLAFDFLEALPDGRPVLTGHEEGVITLNVAEADDDYREKNRETFASHIGPWSATFATSSATIFGICWSGTNPGFPAVASCSATTARTMAKR